MAQSPCDFLRQDAVTPLEATYVAGGVRCRVSTNSRSVLESAAEAFVATEGTDAGPDLFMRFWVDASSRAQGPWPKPYLRGLHHLVYAGFDSGSAAVIDLLSRRIIGRFSHQLALDCDYWKTVIFPMLLSVVAASVGITEIHCACVTKGENGLLLAGETGSGKSTLSAAFAKSGFAFLSDDRTYLHAVAGKISAWSPPTELKLRKEAARWFPDLKSLQPNAAQQGESIFRLDPQQAMGLQRARRCGPRWLICLERVDGSEFHLTRMSPRDVCDRLIRDSMAELPDAVRMQRATIRKLAEAPCWLLRYGGDPHTIVMKLTHVLEDRGPDGGNASSVPRQEALDNHLPDADLHVDGRRPGITAPLRSKTGRYKRTDPLHRFVATRHVIDLPVMGKTVRLETNDIRVRDHARDCFAMYSGNMDKGHDFRWRIVVEPGLSQQRSWSPRFAFSDHGLRFAQYGQRSFLAADLESREGVGFLGDDLASDKAGLTIPFLDNIFCMSAASLGFVSLFANCLANRGRGLLIMGPPWSGKTTATYLAAKLGPDFHADDGVFLERHAEGLRAWGGFWPIVFRPEGLELFPELRKVATRFEYCDFVFYHLEKRHLQPKQARPVAPVACVFLERAPTSAQRLSKVHGDEIFRRLENSVLFKEEGRFREQRDAVFALLANLPAYTLVCGDDQGAVAATLQDLLARHSAKPSEKRASPAAWDFSGESQSQREAPLRRTASEAETKEEAGTKRTTLAGTF